MIQPVLHNVVVKPFMGSEISEGGLFIPDSVRKPSNRVMIVAVGGGTPKRPMKLKPNTVGYRVKLWGEPVEIDGELHYIMNEAAIIATE